MSSKRMLSFYMTCIMLASIFSGMEMMNADGKDGDFGGGDGTSGNPYVIEDVWDLQNMSCNLSAHYILKNDINASATADWNNGSGFQPIGTNMNKFSGSLDGGNHTINNICINRSNTDYVGLIGYVETGGHIKNLGLTNMTITGRSYVGGLIGLNNVGTVNHSYATGILTGTGTYIGGLVGYNDGLVNGSYTIGNVCATGSKVGGLVGCNLETVNNSYAIVNVNVTNSYIGGLIGSNFEGLVNNSYATGDVYGTGSYIGGLVGKNDFGNLNSTINNSYAKGYVKGSNDIGGLVGDNSYSIISNSYATGIVNGTDTVGGLIGNDVFGIISDSFASGHVNGTNNLGGLIGKISYSKIFNSYYNINKTLINGNSLITVGGIFDTQYQDWNSSNRVLNISNYSANLVPYNQYYNISDIQGLRDLFGFASVQGFQFRLVADIELSNYSGFYIPYLAAEFDGQNHTISGLNINLTFAGLAGMFGYCRGIIKNLGTVNSKVIGNSFVGGLVGRDYEAIVDHCFAKGNVTGTGDWIGGLIGYLDGTVNYSYSKGETNGCNYVGGLVGWNGGTVTNSFASVNVNGDGQVGGLMGRNHGSVVRNSYATGNVTGKNGNAGGFEGYNRYSTVSNSYAVGYVTGLSYGLGGFAGVNDQGTITDCFWDNETSGLNSSDGGTGKLTAMMKTRKTFTDAGWDFNSTWCMIDNDTYPLLRWQDGGYPKANAGPDQTVDEDTTVILIGNGSVDYVEIVNYTWTFTDGNPVSIYGIKPSYRFDNPGEFQISLIVKNKAGNRDEDIVTVTVKDITPPVAECGPDQIIDEGDMVTFNGNGSSDNVEIVNYTWTFNDVVAVILYEIKPTYLFDNPGIFVVTLNVTDATGRWDNDTMNVTVNDITVPIADAGADQVIDEGILITFDGNRSSDNVGVVNYTWTFTDDVSVTLFGAKPKYIFDNPGTYIVILNVTDAAANWGTDNMTVIVNDTTAPVADAGSDQIVDEGTLVEFAGNRSIDNVKVEVFAWTFLDKVPVTLYGARPRYTFDNPGSFVVTLNVTDAAGYWDIDTMVVNVNDVTPPSANAGPDQNVDEGNLVMFDGNTSDDNVRIVNYSWTFTDLVTIRLFGANPTYKFNNPGLFFVTLNATDAVGNWNTDNMTVKVNDITAPKADAGPDQMIDEGTIATFNGSRSTDNVGIINYSWTFIGGSRVIIYGVQQTYRFLYPGTYNVTLNITDAAGNWGVDMMTVTVNDMTAPVAVAGIDRSVDEGILITLDGSGSRDNVGIVNYTWTFTDGTPITLYGVQATYKFCIPGVFVVALKVTDVAGNWDVDTMNVSVNDIMAPVADAGPDRSIEAGTLVMFDGSGSLDNVGIFNYTWTFDYGAVRIVLYGVSPSFTIGIPGVYSVKLNVSDAAKCWDADTMTLTVKDITPPVVNAGPDQRVSVESTVVFNGSLTTDNGVIVRRFWNFTYDGKAENLQGEDVSFTFNKGGVFEVILTVIDASGNQAEDKVVITVVDTGMVTGTVLDGHGKPIEAATVEITASNGGKEMKKTGINGSFIIEIHHGDFTWKITKNGYKPISGNSSVKAMDEVKLYLTPNPMIKEDIASPFGFTLIPALLVIITIATVVSIGGYLIVRNKKPRNVGPSPSQIEPAQDGSMEFSNGLVEGKIDTANDQSKKRDK